MEFDISNWDGLISVFQAGKRIVFAGVRFPDGFEVRFANPSYMTDVTNQGEMFKEIALELMRKGKDVHAKYIGQIKDLKLDSSIFEAVD